MTDAVNNIHITRLIVPPIFVNVVCIEAEQIVWVFPMPGLSAVFTYVASAGERLTTVPDPQVKQPVKDNDFPFCIYGSSLFTDGI